MINEIQCRSTLTDEADCPWLLGPDVVLLALAGSNPVERFVKRLIGEVVLEIVDVRLKSNECLSDHHSSTSAVLTLKDSEQWYSNPRRETDEYERETERFVRTYQISTINRTRVHKVDLMIEQDIQRPLAGSMRERESTASEKQTKSE
jgi:hypothetical protein